MTKYILPDIPCISQKSKQNNLKLGNSPKIIVLQFKILDLIINLVAQHQLVTKYTTNYVSNATIYISNYLNHLYRNVLCLVSERRT